ncbi:MAG: hypothetical protein QOJ62_2555 [Actinomycetota bacterium]|nr:hypothetical protein [Actinomycetota bacterium]
MTELTFTVIGAEPERYAASPTLTFRMRVAESSGAAIHALVLHCQLRIQPQQRSYSPAEEGGLLDLFGSRERWGDTTKPFLWTHATTMVNGFTGSTEFDLPVSCTYDFEVSAAKYLHALRDGEVPLSMMFSGTVFSRFDEGLAVERVPWHCDADYRLPVHAWRDLMDLHFPGGGWIRVRRETLDALQSFKSARALPTWDDAFAVMLDGSEADTQSATGTEVVR